MNFFVALVGVSSVAGRPDSRYCARKHETQCQEPEVSQGCPEKCKNKYGEIYVHQVETGRRKPCIFPFKYLGITYNSCTSMIDIDDDGIADPRPQRPWCSVEVDKDGNHMPGKYGWCRHHPIVDCGDSDIMKPKWDGIMTIKAKIWLVEETGNRDGMITYAKKLLAYANERLEEQVKLRIDVQDDTMRERMKIFRHRGGQDSSGRRGGQDSLELSCHVLSSRQIHIQELFHYVADYYRNQENLSYHHIILTTCEMYSPYFGGAIGGGVANKPRRTAACATQESNFVHHISFYRIHNDGNISRDAYGMMHELFHTLNMRHTKGTDSGWMNGGIDSENGITRINRTCLNEECDLDCYTKHEVWSVIAESHKRDEGCFVLAGQQGPPAPAQPAQPAQLAQSAQPVQPAHVPQEPSVQVAQPIPSAERAPACETVLVGDSDNKMKMIRLPRSDMTCTPIAPCCGDTWNWEYSGNELTLTRTDKPMGWKQALSAKCCDAEKSGSGQNLNLERPGAEQSSNLVTQGNSMNGVQNIGQECWNAGCFASGACEKVCGTGSCCRMGKEWMKGRGCTGSNGGKSQHQCVAPESTTTTAGPTATTAGSTTTTSCNEHNNRSITCVLEKGCAWEDATRTCNKKMPAVVKPSKHLELPTK